LYLFYRPLAQHWLFWLQVFFRDAVKAHFGDRLQAIEASIDKQGALYLFTLC
jgi:hypothetical protein